MAFFETAGNAICTIGNSDKPILTSDVWYEENPAYYGSWSLSHRIPHLQREHIRQCEYIFISHGHPDHLNLPSLRRHKHQKILLAQHYGSRIANDLRRAGFQVLCLPDGKWIDIAKNIRVLTFCNELQDSALVTEVTEGEARYLIVNLNDSFARGFKYELASLCRRYKHSFYLQLHGYGDADMINLYDSKSRFVPPFAKQKSPVGYDMYQACRRLNCTVALPFSCFHHYQRRDSCWANQYLTPLEAFHEGWPKQSKISLIEPFVHVNLTDRGFSYKQYSSELELRVPLEIRHESQYGDDWSQGLSTSDKDAINSYFCSQELLKYQFKAIEVQIGPSLFRLPLNGKDKILRFCAPRKSFMNAIRTNTFDNLFIGNFMKVQCFGYAPSIYHPDVGISMPKIYDNGGVSSLSGILDYKNYYSRKRKPADLFSLRARGYYNYVSSLFPDNFRADVKRILARMR